MEVGAVARPELSIAVRNAELKSSKAWLDEFEDGLVTTEVDAFETTTASPPRDMCSSKSLRSIARTKIQHGVH